MKISLCLWYDTDDDDDDDEGGSDCGNEKGVDFW